jgi:transcriptional regulator with XRE-family HTH domain
MSQADLAKKIGLGRSAVSKWESESDIDPGAKALRRAAKVLNTTEEYLLNGKEGSGLEARLSRVITKYQAQINKLRPKEQEELIRAIRKESWEIEDKLAERKKSKQEKTDRSAGSKQEPIE